MFILLTLRTSTQLRECIKTLHATHIHHHDLSPGNILVDTAGRVRLIDFDQGARVDVCNYCDDEEFLETLS